MQKKAKERHIDNRFKKLQKKAKERHIDNSFKKKRRLRSSYSNKRALFAIPGMGGTSVTSGKIEVKFPPQIKPKNDPIEINTPPAFYPEVPGKKKTMQPIIIVPEIIYPSKKKQMIVHHNRSMKDYYNDMIYKKVNPLYPHFAGMNPYWEESLKKNQAYDQLKNDSKYKEAFDHLNKELPIKKGGKILI